MDMQSNQREFQLQLEILSPAVASAPRLVKERAPSDPVTRKRKANAQAQQKHRAGLKRRGLYRIEICVPADIKSRLENLASGKKSKIKCVIIELLAEHFQK